MTERQNLRPSMGIEIELPWPTMLRRVDDEAAEILSNSRGFWSLSEAEQARVQQGFDALDARYLSDVRAAFGPDIAQGMDGYAEFALRPKFDDQELVETTENLYRQGILQAGEEYPLHITLGNVPYAKQSWLILSCLELTGGTSPARIVQTKTWDRKGHAGVLPRKPEELQLGSTEGFEMRTLLLSSPEQLAVTLRLARRLGSLLVGKTRGEREAGERWRAVYRLVRQATLEYSVDISQNWPNPSVDLTPWQQLSGVLQRSELVDNVRDSLLAVTEPN